MNINILISNLTNPVLLFFILGVLATIVKSDLEIPAASADRVLARENFDTRRRRNITCRRALTAFATR